MSCARQTAQRGAQKKSRAKNAIRSLDALSITSLARFNQTHSAVTIKLLKLNYPKKEERKKN
jgi:hypothetical protein